MNLLVGDYLKHQLGAAAYIKEAFVLINWWKWHLVPFAWLQAEMSRPLALLTGCKTRWGSQVAAIMRLLQFRAAMQVLLLRRKQDILNTIKDREPRARAEQILTSAESRFFWIELENLVQNLLPLRISVRTLEADAARLDQVLWQFAKLAAHYRGIDHMMASLEKRWAKMEQKLFLVAFVLHPGRQTKHFDVQHQDFVHEVSIATYAVELYQRFFIKDQYTFEGDYDASACAETDKLFQQMADYMSKTGSFAAAVPRFADPAKDPVTFWKLMTSSAPQLSRLAQHLFQISVNSAAVERLFSLFGNFQTKRRNKFVHDRLQKIAKVKSMLPAKPKQVKAKPAGNQYLTLRSTAEVASAKAKADAAELARVTQETDSEYIDSAEDLIVSDQQVGEVVEEFLEEVAEDARDDGDYQPSSDSITLGNMFLHDTLPQFDMEMLFEDDIPAPC